MATRDNEWKLEQVWRKEQSPLFFVTWLADRSATLEAEVTAARKQTATIREIIGAYPEHDVIEAVRRVMAMLQHVESERDELRGQLEQAQHIIMAMQAAQAGEWIVSQRPIEYDSETPLGQMLDGQGDEVQS